MASTPENVVKIAVDDAENETKSAMLPQDPEKGQRPKTDRQLSKMDQIRAAKDNSKGVCDFIRNVTLIFFGTRKFDHDLITITIN